MKTKAAPQKKFNKMQITALVNKLKAEYGMKWDAEFIARNKRATTKDLECDRRLLNDLNDKLAHYFPEKSQREALLKAARRAPQAFGLSGRDEDGYGANYSDYADPVLKAGMYIDRRTGYNGISRHPVDVAIEDIKFKLIMADATNYQSVLDDFAKTFAALMK